MWIVDDDGDMFNTDYYMAIGFYENREIKMWKDEDNYSEFRLSPNLTSEERLTRYYDLVEKLTGERVDG